MQPFAYCFPEISKRIEERLGQRDSSPPAFRRQVPGSRTAAGLLDQTVPARSSELARADLEQEAYCRGFSDGEKNGFEKGERAAREGVSGRLEKALKSLEKMLSELQRLQNKACRDLERETVQLALDVARKIVGREVQTDVQAVAQMVRTALSQLDTAEHITIRMNPENLQQLAEFAPGMLAEMTDAQRVRFEDDASISCGGCRIESDSGDIDARLERRFKAVQEAFQAEWNTHAVDPG